MKHMLAIYKKLKRVMQLSIGRFFFADGFAIFFDEKKRTSTIWTLSESDDLAQS